MVTYITTGSSMVTPSAVVGYESSRSTHSVVHDVIDRTDPDASLRVAGMREGRIVLEFVGKSAETSSASAEAILAQAALFQLVSDSSSITMAFVLPEGGSLNRSLGRTGASWQVSFDWREVSA